jgi:PemK-like, MazF-like toxin of type II toxin-antitoxin system
MRAFFFCRGLNEALRDDAAWGEIEVERTVEGGTVCAIGRREPPQGRATAGRLRRPGRTRAIGAPTSRRSFRRSAEREPRRVVIVVPTTTRHRGLVSHVEIEPERSGLDELSYAKCEDVKSISEQRLTHASAW